MRLFIVDAFAKRRFAGNQAGVALLPAGEDFPEPGFMQALAAELRHSETAFVKRLGPDRFRLRYFTPEGEVDLCGHATIGTFSVLGAIGKLVAQSAEALGMKVIGYDPAMDEITVHEQISPTVEFADLPKVLKESDFITIHVPALPATKGMINADAIAQMKDGVVFLNFSRDVLVDDVAMAEALASGKVAAYVTDFANPAVVKMERAIVIPHLGASTAEAEDNCAKMAAEELIDYIENGNITNSVNMPNISMPKSGDARICVIHKNVPAVINKISGVISEANINISNMLNKSRKGFAYTMLDMDEKDSGKIEAIRKAIDEMPEVIRVRVI